MDNDPISQLPEPYRTAWRILHASSKLEVVLKQTLEKAKEIADADRGMIFLKEDFGDYAKTMTLPDMMPDRVSNHDILCYALACRAMSTLKNELILNTVDISLEDRRILTRKFLPKWAFEYGQFAIDLLDKADPALSLLIIPICADSSAAGAMVLSRPIDSPPFSHSDLSKVEFFIQLVARYVCAIVEAHNGPLKTSQYLTMVAYETQNQLTSIRGYAELLLDVQMSGELTDDQKHYLEMVLQNRERFRETLSNFREMAELEAGSRRFEITKFDVQDLITQQFKYLKPKFEEKKQNVVFNLGDKVFARGDRIRTGMVLDVMMKNAHLYSPDDAVINISLDIRGEYIRFSISDHGIGLTDDEKDHLFQKLYRSERVHEPGTGLELYIAKHFVEKMGGQIGAEGSPDQGSTFWFTLPIAKE